MSVNTYHVNALSILPVPQTGLRHPQVLCPLSVTAISPFALGTHSRKPSSMHSFVAAEQGRNMSPAATAAAAAATPRIH